VAVRAVPVAVVTADVTDVTEVEGEVAVAVVIAAPMVKDGD